MYAKGGIINATENTQRDPIIFRSDEGAGVAAAKSDAHHFPRQRLYDVADHSRTRHAGVTA